MKSGILFTEIGMDNREVGIYDKCELCGRHLDMNLELSVGV